MAPGGPNFALWPVVVLSLAELARVSQLQRIAIQSITMYYNSWALHAFPSQGHTMPKHYRALYKAMPYRDNAIPRTAVQQNAMPGIL